MRCGSCHDTEERRRAAAPKRRTKAQTAVLDQAIYDLAEEHHPLSNRNIYYLGIGRWWKKDHGGKVRDGGTGGKYYNAVIQRCGRMREEGRMPWEWIKDFTRAPVIPVTHSSPESLLAAAATKYQYDPWRDQPWKVEVWVESDSIKSTVGQLCLSYTVPIFSCRGQSSKIFVWDAVQDYLNQSVDTLMSETGKKTTILYIGDFDPTGCQIEKSIEERIDRYSEGAAPVVVERIAVTDGDATSGTLTAHATNHRDPNYKRFVERCRRLHLNPDESSIETEAIPPNNLRDVLRSRIEGLISDRDAWDRAKLKTETGRWELAQLTDLLKTPGQWIV